MSTFKSNISTNQISDSEQDSRLDLCQVSVCAELRLTGQMKVVLPHSCLLGILHHQHHFLCVRCQDDLKGRVVIWSVIFKKLCTLKRNGNNLKQLCGQSVCRHSATDTHCRLYFKVVRGAAQTVLLTFVEITEGRRFDVL